MTKLAHNPASAARKPRISVALLLTSGLAVAALLPGEAKAEPIHLKLSFFPSERTRIYEFGIKPFVDGINAEGKGQVVIDVYPDGALGKAVGEQPSLLLNGVADIAWVIPGQTPYRFPDNGLFELPGLFRDVREGTLAYSRLLAAKALRGYEPFVVIGAYTSGTTFIHSRKPVTSLASLAGLKIRGNNPTEAKALERLSAVPTVLPASQLAAAIAKGSIDGAALAWTSLFDFDVAPVVTHHYLLPGGTAPLLVLMNRKKFDSLPEAAKALIRKYGGERAAAVWFESYGATENQLLQAIKSDPKRTVVEPSLDDAEVAQQVYRSMIDDWVGVSPYNRELLQTLKAELAKIRTEGR